MLETALIAFTTLFATVGPVDVAAVFAALTASVPARARQAMAIRGVAVATAILLVFALAGEFLLERLGVTLDALRIAGGILLLLIAIDMVFGRQSTASTATAGETAEAVRRQDVAVFPLATPLLAGPGSMGAVMLLIGDAQGDLARQAIVVAMILVMMALSLGLLIMATRVQRLLGATAISVIARVFGILLAALAVQFLLDGLAGSGVVG